MKEGEHVKEIDLEEKVKGTSDERSWTQIKATQLRTCSEAATIEQEGEARRAENATRSALR
jgi:hypothetical protein